MSEQVTETSLTVANRIFTVVEHSGNYHIYDDDGETLLARFAVSTKESTLRVWLQGFERGREMGSDAGRNAAQFEMRKAMGLTP